MIKKLATVLYLIAVFLIPISFSFSVFADGNNALFEGRTGNCNSFLGLTSWDCGVSISDEESLKSGIWTIASNIATDITIIAAYLIIGYVIYGGYLYTFSTGDPGKVASAKKTLFNAFLGLAIVMSAYLIMSTIRLVLIGEKGNFGNCLKVTSTGKISSSCLNANKIFTRSIKWFIHTAGIVSAIFVVYGGISYITSTGDPGKVAKAKQMILYALIGLIIVALAEAITAFVSSMINKADSEAKSKASSSVCLNLTTNPITLKEVYEKQIN